MRHLVLALVALLAVAGCFAPAQEPPSSPTVMLGDSVARQVGDALDSVDNRAVGSSTACDTAATLPVGAPDNVVVHSGGHSPAVFGLPGYDAETWQACMLAIIDHYEARASKVYVAVTPQPLAIFCGWGDYELELRLTEANTWKTATLPALRPSVQLVNWHDAEIGPDCTHLTPAGVDYAARQTRAVL